ncbi:MAG TPA: (deoxy)nucleoside triphosphate pyrophosphohydrolase [Gammaproteobacteria bacterium]|nr:(deoxy)nucleoside triphosphate pyrophosphohydrolase [Gammaproteobacteria bacterium]
MSGPRAVDVVVGLIGDESGRWLVNCRPAGTPLAGAWEFPGGKRLPSESPLAALKRELDEELGLEVLEAEPVLVLEHDYPDKRVRLDVWHVRKYRGRPTARERQPLRWVTVGECRALPLLPADGPIVSLLGSLAASSEEH